MTQNIVSLNLTDDELQAVDAALSELENKLGGLIALSVPQKRSLRKMGEKSEAFCRQAMRLLAQNPELVPANVVAAGPVQDLAMLDKLRPRLLRITRLAERATDTDIALGSDVMVASLQVYGQLKLTGASEGLQSLRRDLGMRFARTSKPEEAKAA
jgi:hypothetical protein